MKLIKLNGKYGEGKFTKVDDWWYDELNQYRWTLSGKGYVERYEYRNGKRILVAMHRLIAKTSNGKITDHYDQDRQNNQENNLRPCTKSQNGANRPKQKNNTTGYKYVTIDKTNKKRPFASQVWHKKKRHWIGSFQKKRWAAMAGDLTARALHGEFATLNFPNAIIYVQGD
jgi:hypothetical protein